VAAIGSGIGFGAVGRGYGGVVATAAQDVGFHVHVLYGTATAAAYHALR